MAPAAVAEQVLTQFKNLSEASIFCGMSFGKDSLVTFDLLFKADIKVIPFFMYFVQDLEFVNRKILFFERFYNTKVIQVPHWMLSLHYRTGYYRLDSSTTEDCPAIKITDVENYLRLQYSEINYFAYGQKICDSLERRAYITTTKKDKFIDLKSRRVFPIATFSQKDVLTYIDKYNIPRPMKLCEGKNRQSGICLEKSVLLYLKQHHFLDYKKIIDQFPFAEALMHEA